MSRSVLWITLESIRQDHTSLADHGRDTTPQLRSLARDGRSFSDCHSHDIWTRASSASILTGYPSSAHRTWSSDAKLPGAIRTIPESFRDASYRTACISPNANLSAATGLDRGFEHFHYLVRSTLLEEAGWRSLAKWALNYRAHAGGATLDGNQHCIGYLSNAIAKRHIETAADTDEPLFLYLHHGDSHHPYVPPVAWRSRFADDRERSAASGIDLALEMSAQLHEFIAREAPFTDDEWRVLTTLYDSTIAYVDSLVGDLVEYARARLPDPIVVVTADHGELFGEHGLLAHMLVTDDAVSRVPLVVAGLDDLPSSGLIQHADVMQAICNELDIDHPVPAGRDPRDTRRTYAVTQRGGKRARQKLETIAAHNAAFPVGEFHSSDLTAVRTDRWRYQRSDDGAELFARDRETTDVSGEHPGPANRLDDYLTEWTQDVGRPVGRTEEATFDDEMAAQLRDLGYLD